MNKKIYIALVFLLLCPNIELNGSILMPQEAFLYMFGIKIALKDRITYPQLIRPFVIYLVLFVVAVLFSSLLSQTFFTAHDVGIVRSTIQMILAIIFFQDAISSSADVKRMMTVSLCIMALPAIFVFVQFFDVFGLKLIVRDLYHPVFGYLDFDVVSEYRSTSVFKDSFSASVYFIVVIAFGFDVLFSSKHTKQWSIGLTLVLAIMYISLIFVGRTGLLFVPLIFFAILFTLPRNKVFRMGGRALLAVAICSIVLYFLYEQNKDEYAWAFEILNLFDADKRDSFSSVTDMAEMNRRFMDQYLLSLPNILLPKHVYDLNYTTSQIYTDNFYFQEMYRYGIFGWLALLIFFVSMLRECAASKVSVIIICVLVILNIKGGNTFLMTKNIYVYAFIFVVLNKVRDLKTVVHHGKYSISHASITLPGSQRRDN